MINLIDLIYIERNLLSDEECDIIVYENIKNETYNENSLNEKLNISYSGGKVSNVNPYKKSIDILNKKTYEIIEQYYFYLKDFKFFLPEVLIKSFKYSHNYRFLTYNVNDDFHSHIDWEEDNSYTGSCTINLSSDYDGGELSFFNFNHDVKLEKGDVVIFPASAFFTHGVKKITRGVRYCVNSFLCPRMLKYANFYYDKNLKISKKYKHEFDFKYEKKIDEKYS
tara:strand:- start:55 stop:726 length:672 start_codon:yes stop_codon:yes gene_type:complete